jgi:hypothetical protein
MSRIAQHEPERIPTGVALNPLGTTRILTLIDVAVAATASVNSSITLEARRCCWPPW